MIKQIYDSLNSEQRELLKYAFENKLTQLVEYRKGWFIGVNVVENATITITESAGYYSIGRLVCSTEG